MATRFWSQNRNRLLATAAMSAAVIMICFGCSGGGSGNGDGDGDGVAGGDYVVLAWNDLGMHCLNPTYDQLIILPPYNTLWAQVVERGDPPGSSPAASRSLMPF